MNTPLPIAVPARSRGFTLLELLMVIIITSVLLGGMLVPLTARIQVQQIHDQEQSLVDLRDALIGFAQTQGRLPCADTDGDGLENGPPPCATQVGELPYATLGVNPIDRWGRLYVYGVSGAMTGAAQTGQPAPNAGLDLLDTGAFTVLERLEDKSTRTVASNAAAVIVSLGINGFGGRDLEGNPLVAPVGADEQANVDGDVTFVTRVRSESVLPCNDTTGTAPFCEFDDLVQFVSTPLLLGRMVQAGRLP